MAGYVKIWTDIKNDKGFVGMGGLERSFWLQLLIKCKHDGDTGLIFVPTLTSLAHEFAISRSSCIKYLRHLVTCSTIIMQQESSGRVHIEVVNYNKYQRVRTPRDRGSAVKNERHLNDYPAGNKIRQYNIREDKRNIKIANANLEEKTVDIVQSYAHWLVDYSISIEDKLSKFSELGSVEYIRNQILEGTIKNYIKAEPAKVSEALKSVDKGDWFEYVARWLDRNIQDVKAGKPLPTRLKEPDGVVELPKEGNENRGQSVQDVIDGIINKKEQDETTEQ